MMLELENRNDVLVIRPVGRLDSASSPELERLVNEHCEAGARFLVFDLADMNYVSAAGLRAMLLAGKKLRSCKGRLALSGQRATVRDVLEMSGFLLLFAISPTVEEAVAQLLPVRGTEVLQ